MTILSKKMVLNNSRSEVEIRPIPKEIKGEFGKRGQKLQELKGDIQRAPKRGLDENRMHFSQGKSMQKGQSTVLI